MIKDIREKNENVKPNSREIEVLKNNFPACFDKDGNFDIDKFKSTISASVDITEENYGLNFLGKNYAKLISALDTETVIEPDKKYNKLAGNKDSQNLYITGDNLDVLKHLTKSYAGSIDVIYIDPPYNTGNDGFVYNDRFKYTADELVEKLNISEDRANKILDFTSKGSASHSAWLSFMYPRLYIARDLLSDNGVIFISIDDNEQAQLKLLCDDVFGEENFISNIIWQNKNTVSNDKSNGMTTQTEFIVSYAKNINILAFRPEPLKEDYIKNNYKNPDNDPRGLWTTAQLYKKKNKKVFPVTSPTGKIWSMPWNYTPESFEELEKENKIYWGVDGNACPRKKIFLCDNNGMGNRNLWLGEEVGYSGDGGNSIEEFLDDRNLFSYPKGVKMMKKIVNLCPKNNALILDFFSGSGTTGQAVMELNAEDGGNRKFILVQLPEAVESKEYKTIDEIGRKRIELSAQKIKKEHPEYTGDLGFKHYTVKEVDDDTIANMEEFDPNKNVVNIGDVITDDTIITTWLCADGYGIDADICKIDLAGYSAYMCENHLYLIDAGFKEEHLNALMKRIIEDPEFNIKYIVLFGYNFNDWSINEMMEKNTKVIKNSNKALNIDILTRF